MTERDQIRVRKALQGADFPASRDDLLFYATTREADSETMVGLRAVPAGEYGSLDEVVRAVPQEPEGSAPGGVDR